MFKNNVEVISLNKPNVTNFAKEKNILLKKAKAPWVLFVDPDEVVTPELKQEIISEIQNTDIQGFFLIRRDFMYNRELKHGEFSRSGAFGNARFLRLARKDSGKWKRIVHEYWDVKGKTKTLKNPLLHYPHPNLRKFISNINYFSGLHALSLKMEGKKSNIAKIIVWPVGKFIYNYFLRLGFLDGTVGLVVAIMMSLHSFLGWSKLWVLQND